MDRPLLLNHVNPFKPFYGLWYALFGFNVHLKAEGILHVLHKYVMEAKPKTVTCVIGLNGSGKSILLNYITDS